MLVQIFINLIKVRNAWFRIKIIYNLERVSFLTTTCFMCILLQGEFFQTTWNSSIIESRHSRSLRAASNGILLLFIYVCCTLSCGASGPPDAKAHESRAIVHCSVLLVLFITPRNGRDSWDPSCGHEHVLTLNIDALTSDPWDSWNSKIN